MRIEINFAIPYTCLLGTQVTGDLNLENDDLIDQEAFLCLFPGQVLSCATSYDGIYTQYLPCWRTCY